jgi:hypothetical protein
MIANKVRCLHLLLLKYHYPNLLLRVYSFNRSDVLNFKNSKFCFGNSIKKIENKNHKINKHSSSCFFFEVLYFFFFSNHLYILLLMDMLLTLNARTLFYRLRYPLLKLDLKLSRYHFYDPGVML